MELWRGRAGEALEHARDSTALADSLKNADDSNTFWAEQRAIAYLYRAEVELALNDVAGARTSLSEGQDAAERLIARDPTVLGWQITLLGKAYVLADRLAQLDRRERPMADLAKLASTVGLLPAGDKALTEDQLVIVGTVLLALGDVLAHQARHRDAIATWQEASRLLQTYRERNVAYASTLLAQADLRLGATAAATALAKRVSQTQFRHPVYADLMKRLPVHTGSATTKTP